MSSCSSMSKSVLVEYHRRHRLKLLNSISEELGEIPLSARTLSYRAFGKGHPVFFFPGNLNSRYFCPAWDKTESIAEKCGIRVIVVDRPGVGRSSLPVCTSYGEFSSVIEELVLSLNIESFGLIGYSSGGPYATACACKLNSRVTNLILVSADGEYANPELGIDSSSIHGVSRDVILKEGLVIAQRNAENLLHSYEMLKQEDRKRFAITDLNESIINGFKGSVQDMVNETQSWNFSIPETPSFEVKIYHGSKDENVPLAVAEWYKCKFSHATMNIVEGESHSMIRRCWEDVLQTISTSTTKKLPFL